MEKEIIVTVFGSSRPREGDADYEEARILGRALAKHGFSVCSGGYVGVMEAVSRGAKEAGGKTTGVTADFFKSAKLNPWIDVEVRMKTWEERLFELIRRADGFVACKGGTGTLVELAVVWEMLNKSVMTGKPLAVLGDFWQPVLDRVREVEVGHPAPWGEANGRLAYLAAAPGRRAVNALERGMERAALESAFALIREAGEWLRAGRELGFGALADPQGWLERIEGPGMALEPGEFLDAASLLETAGWLRQQFREETVKFHLLATRAASVGDFRDVQAAIRRCVLPNGEISDDASSMLRRIRASISETRETIQKNLKQVLRARNAEAGEDYVTLRNDRFVIPVRAEHRRGLPGVVHGASATGQTVFMEPFETVEANNQLVQLAEDEAAEIVRILRELTEKLQMIRGPLLAATGTIAELDSVFARARFAREFDAAMPEFSETNELRLEGARHPVLEDKLRKENRAIVPMTLTLGGEERGV